MSGTMGAQTRVNEEEEEEDPFDDDDDDDDEEEEEEPFLSPLPCSPQLQAWRAPTTSSKAMEAPPHLTAATGCLNLVSAVWP